MNFVKDVDKKFSITRNHTDQIEIAQIRSRQLIQTLNSYLHLQCEHESSVFQQRKFVKIGGFLTLLVLILLTEAVGSEEICEFNTKNRYAYLPKNTIEEIRQNCLSERDRWALKRWSTGPALIASAAQRELNEQIFHPAFGTRMRKLGKDVSMSFCASLSGKKLTSSTVSIIPELVFAFRRSRRNTTLLQGERSDSDTPS
ncbi:MAG: hypothetical protein AAF355_09630 [Myxococcota bacterium]